MCEKNEHLEKLIVKLQNYRNIDAFLKKMEHIVVVFGKKSVAALQIKKFPTRKSSFTFVI